MDLRAAAAVSLSRDDLRYRVSDPSRSPLIDIGDEDSGGSLIGEDIGQTSGRLFLADGCCGENSTVNLPLVMVDPIRVKDTRWIAKLYETLLLLYVKALARV